MRRGAGNKETLRATKAGSSCTDYMSPAESWRPCAQRGGGRTVESSASPALLYPGVSLVWCSPRVHLRERTHTHTRTRKRTQAHAPFSVRTGKKEKARLFIQFLVWPLLLLPSPLSLTPQADPPSAWSGSDLWVTDRWGDRVFVFVFFLGVEIVQENTEKGPIYHKLRHLRGRHMTRFVNTDVLTVANVPPPTPTARLLLLQRAHAVASVTSTNCIQSCGDTSRSLPLKKKKQKPGCVNLAGPF